MILFQGMLIFRNTAVANHATSVFLLHRSHTHYFESRPRSLAQVSCQVSSLQLLGTAQGWGILGI